MRIYISGNIHNQPIGADGRRGSDVFRAAAKRVEELGHRAVVPHDIPAYHGSHAEPYEEFGADACPPAYSPSAACYMRGDLAVLLQCDAMLMVGDWEHSVGAEREHSVACWTGIPVYYSIPTLPDARGLDTTVNIGISTEDLTEARRQSGAVVEALKADLKNVENLEAELRKMKLWVATLISEMKDHGQKVLSEHRGLNIREEHQGMEKMLNALVAWMVGERL